MWRTVDMSQWGDKPQMHATREAAIAAAGAYIVRVSEVEQTVYVRTPVLL